MGHWKWGAAWKDDKLYHFEPSSIVVMRVWPDMRAWRRTKTKFWVHTRSHADAIFCASLSSPQKNAFQASHVGPYRHWLDELHRKRCAEVYAPALASIPAREAGIAFKLQNRRWHALALMARCPGATDLFESNPGLAFCLASNWVFHKPGVLQPLRAARSQIAKKQTRILDWLGFPATERVQKILSRMDMNALNIRSLTRFQRLVWQPEVQHPLIHLPRITASALGFVCDAHAQPRLTPKFLHELTEADHSSTASDSPFALWKDIKRRSGGNWENLPTALHSISQLRRLHDDVLERFRDET